MKPRLLADENTSHRLVAACQQIEVGFPIMHISDWENGAYLSVKDPALLMTLREHEMILVGFDRASMPLHAGTLTRAGVGHAGVMVRTVEAMSGIPDVDVVTRTEGQALLLATQCWELEGRLCLEASLLSDGSWQGLVSASALNLDAFQKNQAIAKKGAHTPAKKSARPMSVDPGVWAKLNDPAVPS